MKRNTRRSKFLIFFTGFVWLAGILSAQEVNKIGTASAAFLRIPVGAKGIAMGGAYTSLADDGSAMFWNPGNVANLSKRVLFIHHSPWLPGLDHDFVGFSFPVENFGVLGLNVVSLRTSDMEITTTAAPMGTGETFTAASTAVGLIYARKLTDRFAIGANIKYVNERIFNTSAGGFAFDIGTMFITPFRGIRFGVSVANIGTELRMDGEDLNSFVDVAPTQEGNNDNIVAEFKTDRFDLPIIMRIGISWDLQLSEEARLTFAVDGVNPGDNAQSVNVGAEMGVFKDFLVLRGGYNEMFLEDSDKGLTFGAGLKAPATDFFNLAVSYAYQDFKYLGAVNHFSLELTF
jgi:hypothetical protein